MARNLRAVAKPYGWWFVAILILMSAAAFLEAIGYSLIVPLIQTFVLENQESAPIGSAGLLAIYGSILDTYTPLQRLRFIAVGIVILFLIKHAVAYGSHLVSTWTWLRISRELRERVWENCLNLDYAFFLDQKQGGLLQIIFHESHHTAFVIQHLILMAGSLLNVLALAGLLFALSWKLSLASVGMGLVIWLFVQQASGVARRIGEHRVDLEKGAMGFIAESIGGIRQIKVFSAEQPIVDVYKEQMGHYLKNRLKHDSLVPLPKHVIQLLSIVVLCGFLFAASYFLPSDLRSIVPTLGAFLVIFRTIVPHISALSSTWMTIQSLLPATDKIVPFLNSDQNGHPRTHLQPKGKTIRPPRQFTDLKNAIQFQSVCFSYPGKPDVLSDVSVDFVRGEKTALVGPSGAGKSTLVDLIARLFEPTSGRILVDGENLRDLDLKSWLDQVGFVSQDTFIFHGSIGGNVAFSRPNATPEEIAEACRQANAHEFIQDLPDGYETVVGDRGVKLSGGQRQRIAIARAILRQPQILILDEATSALDSESEYAVQHALDRISRDLTVIIIAHRFSTVVNADKIVVLDNGRVVEQGTHEQLVACNGRYWSLYQGKAASSHIPASLHQTTPNV